MTRTAWVWTGCLVVAAFWIGLVLTSGSGSCNIDDFTGCDTWGEVKLVLGYALPAIFLISIAFLLIIRRK